MKYLSLLLCLLVTPLVAQQSEETKVRVQQIDAGPDGTVPTSQGDSLEYKLPAKDSSAWRLSDGAKTDLIDSDIYRTGKIGLGYFGVDLTQTLNILGQLKLNNGNESVIISDHNSSANQSVIVGLRAGENFLGTLSFFAGYRAGRLHTGTTRIIGIGPFAGEQAQGIRNLYAGYLAGWLAIGNDNNIVGDGSSQNLEGDRNNILGNSSARNLNGDDNVLAGHGVAPNLVGNDNVGAGSSIFDSGNCTGCIAFGRRVLQATNGLRNIGFGQVVLLATNGDDNIAGGFQSLKYSVDQASRNTAVGFRSQEWGLGDDNTSIGSFSGPSLLLTATSASFSPADVTVGDYTIRIPGHPFGPPGTYFVAQGTSTGSFPPTLVNGGFYQYEVISADTVEYISTSGSFTGQGSGTHTLTMVAEVNNSTAIGHNAEFDVSNQIQLGDNAVTTIRTYGALVLQGQYANDGSTVPGGSLYRSVDDSLRYKAIDGTIFTLGSSGGGGGSGPASTPYIYVPDYGTVGDGVTDDGAALRSAIADAVDQGIQEVWLGFGEDYAASSVSLNGETAILHLDDATFNGLRIRMNGSRILCLSNMDAIVAINGDNNQVMSSIEITDGVFDGNGFTADGINIFSNNLETSYVENLTVTDCDFISLTEGVSGGGALNSVVKDCQFLTCTSDAIDLLSGGVPANTTAQILTYQIENNIAKDCGGTAVLVGPNNSGNAQANRTSTAIVRNITADNVGAGVRFDGHMDGKIEQSNITNTTGTISAIEHIGQSGSMLISGTNVDGSFRTACDISGSLSKASIVASSFTHSNTDNSSAQAFKVSAVQDFSAEGISISAASPSGGGVLFNAPAGSTYSVKGFRIDSLGSGTSQVGGQGRVSFSDGVVSNTQGGNGFQVINFSNDISFTDVIFERTDAGSFARPIMFLNGSSSSTGLYVTRCEFNGTTNAIRDYTSNNSPVFIRDCKQNGNDGNLSLPGIFLGGSLERVGSFYKWYNQSEDRWYTKETNLPINEDDGVPIGDGDGTDLFDSGTTTAITDANGNVDIAHLLGQTPKAVTLTAVEPGVLFLNWIESASTGVNFQVKVSDNLGQPVANTSVIVSWAAFK